MKKFTSMITALFIVSLFNYSIENNGTTALNQVSGLMEVSGEFQTNNKNETGYD
ncbi:hypothetical protein ACE1TH_15950 [Shouchella sp. JSM 1781072]|uniref:hypothetical protein n=1 Tax=Shouchella sp. JSM 1781072 TaxID=3344581 RepID=UPI0035C213EC